MALCCLAIICEGFDLQAPGVTAPALATLFRLSPHTRGLFLSASTFGMMFGAVIGGVVSDRIGRKWVLIGSIAIFGALSWLTALATDVPMLIAARFLTGIGLGGALPNLVAIVVESTGAQRRNTAVGFLLAGPPIGGALVSMVAAAASRPEQWTLVYYVGGLVPLLLVAPVLAFFLPNVRVARQAAGRAGNRIGQAVTVLFGEGRAARTVATCIGLFCILLVLYLLLGWLPSLLVGRGLSRPQASLVQMAFNLASIAGSILAGTALDNARHRSAAVLGVFIVAGVAVALLAASPRSIAFALVLGAAVGTAVTAAQTVIYALAPGCYPRSGRGTGMGFCVAVGRFGSAGGPLLAGALVGSGQSPAQVLAALLPIIAIAGAAAAFVAAANARNPVVEG